jgi:hypothetical protein
VLTALAQPPDLRKVLREEVIKVSELARTIQVTLEVRSVHHMLAGEIEYLGTTASANDIEDEVIPPFIVVSLISTSNHAT